MIITDGTRNTLTKGTGVPTAGSCISGGYVTMTNGLLYFRADVSPVVMLYGNGVWAPYTITQTGITTPATGLSASTVYYLYVYSNAGAPTLSLVTTTPTTQDGIQVMTGDATKLLIAVCRSDASGVIQASYTSWLYYNVYNRRKHVLTTFNGTTHTYATSAWRFYNNDATTLKTELMASGVDALFAGIWCYNQLAAAQFMVWISLCYDTTDGTNPSAVVSLGRWSDSYLYEIEGCNYTTFVPSQGYHTFNVVEYGYSAVVPTFSSPQYWIYFYA